MLVGFKQQWVQQHQALSPVDAFAYVVKAPINGEEPDPFRSAWLALKANRGILIGFAGINAEFPAVRRMHGFKAVDLAQLLDSASPSTALDVAAEFVGEAACLAKARNPSSRRDFVRQTFARLAEVHGPGVMVRLDDESILVFGIAAVP
jgi:hypothetical protein